MECIIHGVTKSWTRLSDFHFYFLNLTVSFLTLALGFVCSFSNSFRWNLRLFEIFLVSWGSCVSSQTSLLKLLLLHYICFRVSFFPLSFVLRYFLISSLISWLTHWYFSNIFIIIHILFFSCFLFYNVFLAVYCCWKICLI